MLASLQLVQGIPGTDPRHVAPHRRLVQQVVEALDVDPVNGVLLRAVTADRKVAHGAPQEARMLQKSAVVAR
jgi:hypothetical protein